MKSYSVEARVFICLVWLAGLSILVATLLLPALPGETWKPISVGVAAIAAVIAGTRKVYLPRSEASGQSLYVTLGFLVTFAALLELGVRAGVLAGVLSALSADAYSYFTDTRKRPIFWHKMLFNAASIAVTAWCSGQVFAALNHTVAHVRPESLFAVMVAFSTYFFLNIGFLAGVVALCTRQRLRSVYRDNFWAFPVHLMGAAYVALGLIFIKNVYMILFAASVTPFAYQYYKLYADYLAQKQNRIDELQAGREALGDLYVSTVKSLATAIGAKDRYTHAHIQRVQHYALAIAQQLEITGDPLEAIRTGAVLHDIGKLGVPDYVLLKPGRLSPDEYAKMKRHPVIGADILKPVDFPWPVADIVRHHHERWDGKGYPDGLAGENIPLGARVLSVADVYDALTSDRPYREAWAHERATEYLQMEAGVQFDPRIVSAFLQVVDASNAAMQSLQAEQHSADRVSSENEAGNAAWSASHQIGRTASELWVLYEVSQTLNSSAPLQERLALLAQKLTVILPGTTCAFLLHDTPEDCRAAPSKGLEEIVNGNSVHGNAGVSWQEQTGRSLPCLRVAAAAGVNADILYANSVLGAQSLSALAARSGKIYRGAYMDHGLEWSVSEWPLRPVRSIVVVPLVCGQETLGTMTFYHCNADAFTIEDEQLLTMIAEQVQTALHQDREYDRTRSDANTDSLTGLHNMRFLRNQAASLLESTTQNGQADFALLYLDLDNFKNVNTLYGHPHGSRVLSDVARLLPRELRPTDVAVRYGGDEFVVVLPQTSEAGAYEVAARIRTAICSYRPDFLPDFDPSCWLDVSIGVACCPTDSADMDALVAVADKRMYAIKTAQKLHAAEPDSTVTVPLFLDTAVVSDVMERWLTMSGR